MVIGHLINNANPFFNPSQGDSHTNKFEIYINNVNITDSGISLQDDTSYCIGALNLVKSGTYNSSVSFTNLYPAFIEINGLKLTSSYIHTNQVYGILANPEEVTSVSNDEFGDDHYAHSIYDLNKIAYMYVNGFENNINGLTASIAPPNTIKLTIQVACSANHGNTTIAWGGVTALTNCINTGRCSSWGATQSNNCFDIAEQGTYQYGSNIMNSFILFENADGSYYCYTSGGKLSVVSNITLVTKEWFVSFLSFDENIWNLDDFDLSNNIYPTFRS